MFIKNARGFSLVELAVVAAISGALLTGSVVTISMMTDTARRSDAKSGGQQLARDLEQAIAEPSKCVAALGALPYPLTTGQKVPLTMNVGGRVVGTGTIDGNGFKVKSLYLLYGRDLGYAGPNSKPVYYGDVMLSTQANDPNAPQVKDQRVTRVYFETIGATVVSCSNQMNPGSLAGDTCAQMGGAAGGGTCDITPFKNQVVARSQAMVDSYLWTQYKTDRVGEINSNIQIAMNDVIAKGAEATKLHTNQRMKEVADSLTTNLAQVNGRVDQLNTDITNSAARVAYEDTSSRAFAQDIYTRAIASYNDAVSTLNTAQDAAARANQAAINVASASGVAGSALSFGTNSMNNSQTVSTAAYTAMNNAMGAASTAQGALSTSSASLDWANANLNYATNVKTYADNTNAYANYANEAANQSATYASSATTQANAAAGNAQAAAQAASYAAGVASAVYASADFAYNNPPTVTQVNNTVVTYVPKAPAAKKAYWIRQDPLLYSGFLLPHDICPNNQSPSPGQCTSVNRYCSVNNYMGTISDLWFCAYEDEARYFCESMVYGKGGHFAYGHWRGCSVFPPMTD